MGVNRIPSILYTLVTHAVTFSNEDVILNKEVFGEYFHVGDFIRLVVYEKEVQSARLTNGSSGNLLTESVTSQADAFSPRGIGAASTSPVSQVSLILRVTSFRDASSSGRMEISINKQMADPLNIKNYSRVSVEKVDPAEYHVDFIELTFKKQFLQRGNMWRFKMSMHGRPGVMLYSYFFPIDWSEYLAQCSQFSFYLVSFPFFSLHETTAGGWRCLSSSSRINIQNNPSIIRYNQ
jgi:hypothetical protein